MNIQINYSKIALFYSNFYLVRRNRVDFLFYFFNQIRIFNQNSKINENKS